MALRNSVLASIVLSALIPAGAACAVEQAASTPGAKIAPSDASLAAYRAYAREQADALVLMTKVLAKEIKAGDLDAAQNAYAPAHRYLERIRPISKLSGDLDRRMDATAEDYDDKENDLAFSGFHLIEYGLFARRSTLGLAAVADRLHADAMQLQAGVATLAMAPDKLRDAPAELVEAAAPRAAAGESELYSRTDLWDVEANVDGARAIVAVLRPEIDVRDPALAGRIRQRMAETDAQLSRLKDGCGFKSYEELNQADRRAVKASVAALAAELSRLRRAVAVD